MKRLFASLFGIALATPAWAIDAPQYQNLLFPSGALGSGGGTGVFAITTLGNVTGGALQNAFNNAGKLLPSAGNGTVPAGLYGSGLATILWNLSGGGRETDLIADSGSAAQAGWWFMDTNSGSPRHLADLTASTGLSVPYYTNAAAPGPAPPPRGIGGGSFTRTSSSAFDAALGSRGIATTPGDSGWGGYLVGEINHGAGISGSGPAIEVEARNWSSVAAGVYTAHTGWPPDKRLAFTSLGGGTDTNAHGEQATCSDPDGWGCTTGLQYSLSGLYGAPFLIGIYGAQASASWYGQVLDSDTTTGPAITSLMRNAGNLNYATAISSVAAGGSGYSAGCVVPLTDVNAGVKTVLVVDTVTGSAVATAHIDIPGVTTTVPSNPVSQSGTAAGTCGGTVGTGATFNMTYAAGKTLVLQTMGTQVAGNSVLEVQKSDGTVNAKITQSGSIIGSNVAHITKASGASIISDGLDGSANFTLSDNGTAATQLSIFESSTYFDVVGNLALRSGVGGGGGAIATFGSSGTLNLPNITTAASCSGQPSGNVIATTGTGVMIKCP